VAAGAVTAAGAALTLSRRNAGKRVPSFPSGPVALAAADAAAFAARMAGAPIVRKRDLAVEFAPAAARGVEPLLHGTQYFPRMLDDLRAASSSIHVLIYGIKPGDVGSAFRDILLAKVAEGIPVRVSVDAVGSEVRAGSRPLFRELVDGGVQVVQNRGLFPDVRGPLGPGAPLGWRRENVLHFDHRKFMVIDGRIGWLGGTGIEDHFNDERFTDVMVRFEGPVVRQLQALFVASWRHQEGSLVADDATIAALFPPDEPTDEAPGDGSAEVPAHVRADVPATLLVNVPGTGHVPISEAYEQVIDAAERRVDLVNPYISERPILDRLVRAAERGVAVRIIVPGKPTPPMPAAAFRHNVPRLQEAGATVLFHPTMAHAKVMVADDRVLVGGCNLDALSLYRNWELNVLLEGEGVAADFERAIFAPLVEVSAPADLTRTAARKAFDALMDRASPLL
jgi:cardiolipin synthase